MGSAGLGEEGVSLGRGLGGALREEGGSGKAPIGPRFDSDRSKLPHPGELGPPRLPRQLLSTQRSRSKDAPPGKKTSWRLEQKQSSVGGAIFSC